MDPGQLALSRLAARREGCRGRVQEERLPEQLYSYRLALTKDINSVAYESGNSPQMIRKYYLGLVTPEAAQEWFEL